MAESANEVDHQFKQKIECSTIEKYEHDWPTIRWTFDTNGGQDIVNNSPD